MTTFVLFLVLLFWLVIIHEAGHFFAARFAGIKVEEFGIGFPPRIFGFMKKGTRYSVNLLPFGGFVKLLGEEGSDAGDPTSFAAKPLRIRLAVLFAGVAMNWLGAVVLLSVILFFGAPLPTPDAIEAPQATVSLSAVVPGSPAFEAGLKAGDRIVAMEAQGDTLAPGRAAEVQEFIKKYSGKEVVLTIRRGAATDTVTLVPRLNPPPGQGALGVQLVRIAERSFPWYEAPWRAGFIAANITVVLVQGFVAVVGGLFAGQAVGDALAGPVGIAALTGDVAGLGLPYLAYFAALLSINLAILNAIPFPALDGGRAWLLIGERLTGRAIPRKISEAINATGFALLILLLIFLTVNDITKRF